MSSLRTDTFDLGGLRLTSGEGRRLDLSVAIEPFSFAGDRYPVEPALVPVRLDVSRTTGDGYALRMRFEASIVGPCMRCLEPAAPTFAVDAREVWQPHEARGRRGEPAGRSRHKQEPDIDDLVSPYVEEGALDLRRWARDALALTLPANLLCREDCAGLCPVCGANLNEAGPDHQHEREPDPRWAALSELRFE
ncbi:MAG: YceD family protein [Solirubrobacteraceae bacterium]